jgi:hypothetical protein
VKTGRVSTIVFVIVLLCSLGFALNVAAACQWQPPKSCFNGLQPSPEQDWDNYTISVVGHIRAAPGKPSPNGVMREHVSRLFARDQRLVIALGDLYYNISHGSDGEISNWIRAEIPIPFLNVVGNHDTMTGGDKLPGGGRSPSRHDAPAYQSAFGPLYYSFSLGSELYIALDTSRGYRLSAEQLAWFEEVVAGAESNPGIRNVFLLTHKVIWSYYNPVMEPVFRYRHPVRPPQDYNLFRDSLEPSLLRLAKTRSVYLLAGDIGGGRKYLQTFYYRDSHFTYLATGMGNTDRDSFITVVVKNGEVALKLTNFTSGEDSDLANYGLNYWREYYLANPHYAQTSDRIGSAGQ